MLDHSTQGSSSGTNSRAPASRLTTSEPPAMLSAGQSPTTIQPVIIHAPVIDSTMNCATYLANHNVALQSGQVIVAGKQTGGVGMRGSWVSDDRDLAFTIVLNDPTTLRENILTGVAAAIAVIEATEHFARINNKRMPSIGFKPLNDVLMRDNPSHPKLSGILEVGSFQGAFREKYRVEKGYYLPEGFFLVGVGINLTSHAETQPGLRRPATSVESLIGLVPEKNAYLDLYLSKFFELLKMIQVNDPSFIVDRVKPRIIAGEYRPLRIVSSIGQVHDLNIVGYTNEELVCLDPRGKTYTFPFTSIRHIVWDIHDRRPPSPFYSPETERGGER